MLPQRGVEQSPCAEARHRALDHHRGQLGTAALVLVVGHPDGGRPLIAVEALPKRPHERAVSRRRLCGYPRAVLSSRGSFLIRLSSQRTLQPGDVAVKQIHEGELWYWTDKAEKASQPPYESVPVHEKLRRPLAGDQRLVPAASGLRLVLR